MTFVFSCLSILIFWERFRWDHESRGFTYFNLSVHPLLLYLLFCFHFLVFHFLLLIFLLLHSTYLCSLIGTHDLEHDFCHIFKLIRRQWCSAACIYWRNMRKTRTTRIVKTRYWKCVSKYTFFCYRNIIKWWIYSKSDPKPHLSRAHRSQSHHIILVSLALYLLLYHMRLVSLKDKRKRKPTTFVFCLFWYCFKMIGRVGKDTEPLGHPHWLHL